MKVILAIDLGTTGNRVIAFSKAGEIVAKSYYEFPQIFPKPGYVEHNALDIWETTLKALKDVLQKVGPEQVDSIGITNQRETTVLWDKTTGEPVYHAIVWQCRRTTEMCKALVHHEPTVRAKTGLLLDPYFSATKIKWMMDHVPGVKEKVRQGRVLFGTVDTWILWKLTGGKVHATEPSNASRTLCLNIHTGDYDQELLDIFDLPRHIFPAIRESSGLFGVTDSFLAGREIPITGILGDQQASLFAQVGWEKEAVKSTYGTGLFLMKRIEKPILHESSLVQTVAWCIDHKLDYALEGSVFVGGSAVQWLRDGLGLIQKSSDAETVAASVPDNGGVYFVPALAGLGAPYWDPDARGVFAGITRGTTAAHFVRAASEAMAYQVRDVVEEMEKLTNQKIRTLRVDGGAVRDTFLMQFQADLLNCMIERPKVIDTTAFGVAGAAGLASGFWTREEFINARKIDRVFSPAMPEEKREGYYQFWKRAVERSRHWNS